MPQLPVPLPMAAPLPFEPSFVVPVDATRLLICYDEVVVQGRIDRVVEAGCTKLLIPVYGQVPLCPTILLKEHRGLVNPI